MKTKYLPVILLMSIIGCSIGTKEYSEIAPSHSEATDKGLWTYTVGSSNNKVDWIVIAKGKLKESVTSGVLTSVIGEKIVNQSVNWKGNIVPLYRNSGVIYDQSTGKKLTFKQNLTTEECKRIFEEKGYEISGDDFSR